MAQVPNVPAPNVQPSATPQPNQQLDAPAQAFGASVAGQVANDFSAAQGKVSDQLNQYATQFQAINNKQAADNASNQADIKIKTMWAQFQANNTQANAVNNYPQFLTDVEQARNSFGEGLSPLAKVEFEAASRRNLAGVISEAAGYAASQRRVAIHNTAVSTVQVSGDNYVTNPTPENEAAFKKTLGVQAAQVFAPTGLPPDDPQVREWMKQQASPVYGSMVKQAYDSGDLAKAQSLLAEHRDDMTAAEYTTLAGGLRVADHANTIQSWADANVNGGTGPTDREAVWSAIKNQETGNRPGLTGPVTVYGQAHGIGQTMDATAKEMAQKLGLPWQPELMTQKTPEAAAYQEKLGRAYFDQAMVAEHGDVHRALEYYYGGPDESKWGPKTREYADTVSAKLGGGASAVAPIPFSPSMTADEYVANGDLLLQQRAKDSFMNAADRNQAFSAAHQQLMINAQIINKTQGAVQDKLQGFVLDNGVTDITAVQKAFPTEWANLPSKYQQSLERDVQFQGSQETPERLDRLNYYNGLMMSNPGQFADPVKTDLHADQGLSISDRKTLMAKQVQMHNSEANKKASSTKLNTYLANPAVASIVKTNFPDKTTPEYNTFIGALQGQVDSLELKEGHSPSQQEITTAAQNIITKTTTGGVNILGLNLGGTTTSPTTIPPDAEAAIKAQYQRIYKRDPSAYELQYAYQRGPSYYGR